MGNHKSIPIDTRAAQGVRYEVRADFKRPVAVLSQLGGKRAFAGSEDAPSADRSTEEIQLRQEQEARDAFDREHDAKPAGTEVDPEEAIDLDPDEGIMQEDDELNDIFLDDDDLDADEGAADRRHIGRGSDMAPSTTKTHKHTVATNTIDAHSTASDAVDTDDTTVSAVSDHYHLSSSSPYGHHKSLHDNASSIDLPLTNTVM